MLTIKQIADELGVTEGGIRYHRDIYAKYLPSLGEGRKKRYYPICMEVFRIIFDMTSHNKKQSEIESVLANKTVVNLAVETQNDTQTSNDKATLEVIKPQNIITVVEKQTLVIAELRYALEENNKMMESQNKKIDEMSLLLVELKNSQKSENTNLLKKMWQKLKFNL